MKTETLQNMLDQLQDELSKVKAIDEDLRERLEQTMVDIEMLLNESDINGEHHRSSLIKRLRKTVDDFELSHPELTTTLGDMAESLSRMGF